MRKLQEKKYTFIKTLEKGAWAFGISAVAQLTFLIFSSMRACKGDDLLWIALRSAFISILFMFRNFAKNWKK